MNPTTFVIDFGMKEKVRTWLNSSLGPKDALRWNIFHDCGFTKIKIIQKEHATLFKLSCSDWIV